MIILNVSHLGLKAKAKSDLALPSMCCWKRDLCLLFTTMSMFLRKAYSLTDKAERKPLMIGLTLLIVLRSTLIAGMDPPDLTVTFFRIIPPPRGVVTVVPVNFA